MPDFNVPLESQMNALVESRMNARQTGGGLLWFWGIIDDSGSQWETRPGGVNFAEISRLAWIDYLSENAERFASNPFILTLCQGGSIMGPYTGLGSSRNVVLDSAAKANAIRALLEALSFPHGTGITAAWFQVFHNHYIAHPQTDAVDVSCFLVSDAEFGSGQDVTNASEHIDDWLEDVAAAQQTFVLHGWTQGEPQIVHPEWMLRIVRGGRAPFGPFTTDTVTIQGQSVSLRKYMADTIKLFTLG